MRISKRSQQKFADYCTARGVVRTIQDIFEAEDFEEPEDFEGGHQGVRRSLLASFHSLIDFDDEAQQQRLLRVYLSAIDDWGRDWLSGELDGGAKALIRELQKDGAPIDNEGHLLQVASAPITLSPEKFERLSQPQVLVKHLERIGENLAKDPAASIGASKELVESTCKFVLDGYGEAYGKSDRLLDLYKATAVALKIDRGAVPGNRKGSQAAQRVLQNLASAVQSMAELRNELGLGHGRTSNSEALERHARLPLTPPAP